MRQRTEGWIYFAGFVGTVWLANYLITHVGVQFDPHGPHTIPVWPGVFAPSGVLAAGLGFTLRDLVQRRLGAKFSVLAVLLGAALSMVLSPALAIASGGAFLASEMLDLFVYTPLRKKNIYVATVASNIVGLVVDSVFFLLLAFGSLDFLLGQVIGKAWMTLLAIPVIALIQSVDRRRGVEPRVSVRL